jgi:hypothetical protein
MKKQIILPLALCLLLPACGTNNVNTQPKLTPEQVWAMAKNGAVTATNALALLISELEKRPGVSLEKLRVWRQVHAVMVEMNAELEDFKIIEGSNRATIAAAVDKVLTIIDNLIKKDVLPIVDIKLKGEISAGIQLVRAAIEGIRALLPVKK